MIHPRPRFCFPKAETGGATLQARASNHGPGQGDLYLISPAERAKVSAIAL
jgi:hypothetical protein